MMRRRALLETAAIVLVGILVTFLVHSRSGPSSVDIVTGSSFISIIIQNVTAGELETRTIIPPGVCPGDYDVKPSEIEALANCRALFIHNYQQNYQNILGAIEAAANSDLAIKVLNVTGNWMVPQVQAEGVNRIAQALSEIYPENAAYYQGNATQRAQAILTYGEGVRDRLQDAGVDGVKVICAAMQEGFVRWAGFNITATVGRPEELSLGDVGRLITQAKDAGLALVINNLQSGSRTLPASLEQDIEAIPVTISNFPGGLEDTETWEKAIDKNVDLLLDALNEWREQHG